MHTVNMQYINYTEDRVRRMARKLPSPDREKWYYDFYISEENKKMLFTGNNYRLIPFV